MTLEITAVYSHKNNNSFMVLQPVNFFLIKLMVGYNTLVHLCNPYIMARDFPSAVSVWVACLCAAEFM